MKIFLIIIILTFICGIWYNFDMIWLRFKWVHRYFSVTCKELPLPSWEASFLKEVSLRRARRWNATNSFFDGALTRWHFNGTSTLISTRKTYETRSADEIHETQRVNAACRLSSASWQKKRKREYHKHFVPFAIVSSLPNAAPATGEVHRKFYYSILIITLTRGARYRQTDT